MKFMPLEEKPGQSQALYVSAFRESPARNRLHIHAFPAVKGAGNGAREKVLRFRRRSISKLLASGHSHA